MNESQCMIRNEVKVFGKIHGVITCHAIQFLVEGGMTSLPSLMVRAV